MIFFDDVTNTNDPNSSSCIAHIRPYSELVTDLQQNTQARYNFITPNLCNDMHNCSIAQGDAFVRGFLGNLLNAPTWGSDDVVFITFDEGSRSDRLNLVPLIVVSDRVRSGFRSATAHTHYSLLRTIEDSWGLPCLGQACAANDLSEFFTPRG